VEDVAMLNLCKASLLGLIICCLAFSTLGCRKKTAADNGTPEDIGEIESVYDIEIGENEWQAPEAVSPEIGSIYRTVYFDLDKSDIRPESRPALEAIADDLKATRGRYLRAVGHCCERGTNEYNFGLGARRAESVKAYLVALGVDSARIRTLSKGEEEPAVLGHDEASLSQNRRVEFWIVDK
jgi:peptidoglycan-associated lipoprotein